MINHVVGNLQGNGGRIHPEDGEIHQPDDGGDIGEPGVTQGGAERDVRGEVLAVAGDEPLPAVRRREHEHRVARAFGLLHRVGARAGHGGAGGSDPRRRVGTGAATAGPVLVNLGDMTQIASNGRHRSPLHRATVGGLAERVCVVSHTVPVDQSRSSSRLRTLLSTTVPPSAPTKPRCSKKATRTRTFS